MYWRYKKDGFVLVCLYCVQNLKRVSCLSHSELWHQRLCYISDEEQVPATGKTNVMKLFSLVFLFCFFNILFFFFLALLLHWYEIPCLIRLIDYLPLYVPHRNFSLTCIYADVTFICEGLQNPGLCSELRAFEHAGRDLYRATLAVTGYLCFSSLIQMTTLFSRGMWRIYFNPDPHWSV
jgi:hypothetical protein